MFSISVKNVYHIPIAIGLSAFSAIVCNIFIIYCTWIYFRHSRNPFIRNRNPEYILFHVSSIIIMNTVYLPLCMIETFLPLLSSQQISFHTAEITYLVVLSGLYRFWLLYYEYHSNQDLFTTRVSQQIGWYLKYSKILGNPRICFVMVLILFGFLVGIVRGIRFLDSQDVRGQLIGEILIISLTAIAMVFLLVRISAFDDVIMIRKETFSAAAVLALVFGIAFSRQFIFDSNSVLMQRAFLTVVFSLGGCTSVYVQTIRVLKMARDFEESTSTENPDIPLPIFCHRVEGYILFLKYLSKEYANESLLFLSEVVIFIRDYGRGYQNDGLLVGSETLMELTNDIPTSTIMKIPDWRTRFQKIFDLYIDENGDRCINIPYTLRQDFQSYVTEHFRGEAETIRTMSTVRSLINKFTQRSSNPEEQMWGLDAGLFRRGTDRTKHGVHPGPRQAVTRQLSLPTITATNTTTPSLNPQHSESPSQPSTPCGSHRLSPADSPPESPPQNLPQNSPDSPGSLNIQIIERFPSDTPENTSPGSPRQKIISFQTLPETPTTRRLVSSVEQHPLCSTEPPSSWSVAVPPEDEFVCTDGLNLLIIAALEMQGLMRGSYARFCDSHLYATFAAQFK